MELLKLYLPLCWFKNHPLQLPSSVPFFKANVIFYFTVEFFTQANMIPPSEAFFEVIMDTSLTLLFIFAVLGLNRSTHNYMQVACAVLVCENVMSVFGVPVIVWLVFSHHWLAYTLLAALMIWDYALITYLMRKVLAVDMIAGVIVAFLYFATTYGIAYSLTLAF